MSKKVTIVIPCKGRLHHLKQTRDALLSQDTKVPYDVLVVDYGCPDDTFNWCVDNGLSCLRIKDNVEVFNLNRCRNLGIRHSKSDIVGIIDVDLIPSPYFISKALSFMALYETPYLHYAVHSSPTIGGWGKYAEPIDGGYERYAKLPISSDEEGVYASVPVNFDLICSFMRRDLWSALSGYDEEFSGWGFDDVDFRERAISLNTRDCLIGGEFNWINHWESESVRFYTNKDKNDTKAKNLARLLDRARSINLNGYGITENYESHENNRAIS